MNIKVIREAMNNENSMDLGGEYGTLSLDIYIDESLPRRTQINRLIHAVVEGYNCNWENDKVEQLTDLIQDALDAWGEA